MEEIERVTQEIRRVIVAVQEAPVVLFLQDKPQPYRYDKVQPARLSIHRLPGTTPVVDENPCVSMWPESSTWTYLQRP